MKNLVTLDPVRFNNWIVKASIFDDQILIFFLNVFTMQSYCRVFYDEEMAHLYMEKFVKVNK